VDGGDAMSENNDELYRETKALFGYLSLFGQNWEEAYRPVLDMHTIGVSRTDEGECRTDILYMSRFGSYVRVRARENVNQEQFHRLYEMCNKRHLYARRNRLRRHERSIDE
jgi:hypothetical protein